MMVPGWILVVSALILLAYLWGIWNYKYFDKLNIPFDKPTLFVGNMGALLFKKKSFADIFIDLYNKYRGSGIIGFYRLRKPTILLCDPELIKLITVKEFDHFTDHFALVGEDDDPLFGKILFAMKGDRWKFMRHTLSPAYTSSKMKSMHHLVTDCGVQLGDYLEKKCQESGGLVTTDMKDLFTRFGNDVIATSAFGIHCDSLNQPDNEFYVMGKRSLNFSGIQLLKATGFRLFARLMRLLNIKLMPKDVNDFFQNLVKNTIIQREQENIIRPDMIQLLMEAKKGTLKTENTDELSKEDQLEAKRTNLTYGDITAQAFVFFLAGFETTSTLLCFISHHLATNPDIHQRIQDEIDSVLEEGTAKITYESLQRMKYTDMVINEALRLWPPTVTVDRVCVKPYTIPATDKNPSFHVNVGDAITIPVIAMHRDPTFFENPLEFDPERFNEENKPKITPFSFLPFGAGPRFCIGMRFAVMETKIALASVLSRFDLKVVPKTQNPLKLDKRSTFLNVEGGFWLGITPRTTKP